MKALLTAALALTLLTLLPMPAQAQMNGQMTVVLQAPEEALGEGGTLTFVGYATVTADYTALTGVTGIPVTYTVTQQPEWATVTISPSTDIFTIGFPAPGQTAFTGTKAFTITVSLKDAPAEDTTDVVEVTATTTPGMLGRALTGKGQTQIAFDAPDEPCPEHAFDDAELAALAVEAADAYNAYQADQARADEPEDVTVQSTGASPVTAGWAAVAGLGLVGAGVGLLLRRRFG